MVHEFSPNGKSLISFLLQLLDMLSLISAKTFFSSPLLFVDTLLLSFLFSLANRVID